MVIDNAEQGFKTLIRYLESQGKKIYNVIDMNKSRHLLVLCGSGEKYYLMFKRQPFLSWKNQFELIADKPEIMYVDSINVSLLYKIKEKLDPKSIMIIYEDGTILEKDPTEWLRIANQYQLYRRPEKKERIVKDNKPRYEEEPTASVFFTIEDVLEK